MKHILVDSYFWSDTRDRQPSVIEEHTLGEVITPNELYERDTWNLRRVCVLFQS